MEDNGAKDRRIDSLFVFIKMTAFDTRAKIPETVIDNFFDQIVYDLGVFIWYLNPTYGNEVYRQKTSNFKKWLQESFSNMYLFLGDHVGMAWGEGKKFH